MAQPVVVVGGDAADGGDATAAFAAGAATVVSAQAAEDAATAAAVAADAAATASTAADAAFDAQAEISRLRSDMEAGFGRMQESFLEIMELVTEEAAGEADGAAPELVDQGATPAEGEGKKKRQRDKSRDLWFGSR